MMAVLRSLNWSRSGVVFSWVWVLSVNCVDKDGIILFTECVRVCVCSFFSENDSNDMINEYELRPCGCRNERVRKGDH